MSRWRSAGGSRAPVADQAAVGSSRSDTAPDTARPGGSGGGSGPASWAWGVCPRRSGCGPRPRPSHFVATVQLSRVACMGQRLGHGRAAGDRSATGGSHMVQVRLAGEASSHGPPGEDFHGSRQARSQPPPVSSLVGCSLAPGRVPSPTWDSRMGGQARRHRGHGEEGAAASR